jgi:hypothetical protein
MGRSHTFEEATLPAGSDEEQTTVRNCQAKTSRSFFGGVHSARSPEIFKMRNALKDK